MRIKIDENYALESDKRNWSITKKSVSQEGEDSWRYEAHFPNPGTAIKWLANREIRLSEATTFLEAVEKVNKIEEKYNKILTVVLKEVDKNE